MDVPMGYLRAFVTMRPRLEAEESLLAAQRGSVASGFMKAEDSRRIIRSWETQKGDRPERTRRATPGQLRDMGISYVEVSR